MNNYTTRHCKICNKEGDFKIIKKYDSEYYCIKHLYQIKKYNKIIDESQRTIFTKNEFIILKDYAEIVIYNFLNKEILRTMIDTEDVEKCKQYKWCYSNSSGYCCTTINKKIILLHNYILGLFDKDSYNCVDHIDRNKTNNKKNNLRICMENDNHKNLSKRQKTSSDIIGVSWSQERKKWVAQICVNKKNINLGRFENIEDAIKTRLKAEKQYFKEYCSTHNPDFLLKNDD